MKEFRWSDLTEEETKQMVDKALKHISENSEHINTWQEYLDEMKKLAQDNCVELTDNAINIARFRARSGLPLEKCPCSPLDKERGCISKKCLDEIEMFGKCHCRCFRGNK